MLIGAQIAPLNYNWERCVHIHWVTATGISLRLAFDLPVHWLRIMLLLDSLMSIDDAIWIGIAIATCLLSSYWSSLNLFSHSMSVSVTCFCCSETVPFFLSSQCLFFLRRHGCCCCYFPPSLATIPSFGGKSRGGERVAVVAVAFKSTHHPLD